ncbi:MAG: hypothetical protein EXS46_02315 [Candidatus Taylorbacteria bacterium]|nr:hypothetical protein [Candidatus Taylorbacteria bacterium]
MKSKSENIPIRFLYYVLFGVPFLALVIYFHAIEAHVWLISFFVKSIHNEAIKLIISTDSSVWCWATGTIVFFGSIWWYFVGKFECKYNNDRRSFLVVFPTGCFFVSIIWLAFSMTGYFAFSENNILYSSPLFQNHSLLISSVSSVNFDAYVEGSGGRPGRGKTCGLSFVIQIVGIDSGVPYNYKGRITEIDRYAVYELYHNLNSRNVPINVSMNGLNGSYVPNCSQKNIEEFKSEIETNTGLKFN